MLKNFTVLLGLPLLFTGCSSSEKHYPHHDGKPEKISLTINVNQAPAEHKVRQDKAVKKQPPANTPRKNISSQRKYNAAGRAADKRRQQSNIPRGSIDGDLNSVEQQHLREIRRRNQQQKMENEKRVFGGFSAGELFK